MRGEEIFNFAERSRELEKKKLISGELSEQESMEFHKIKNNKILYSLDDIKEYHDYVRKLLKNVSEIKEDLLKQFGDVCSPGSFGVIKEIVESVCDSNLYLKGMWGKGKDF